MADDAARLAGRRRHRAARRSRRARRARTRSACRPGGVRGARLPSDQRRGGRSSPRRASTRATFPTAIAPPTCSPATACSTRGSAGLDVAPALDAARLPRRGGGGLRHAATAGVGRLPPDLGDHRRRRHGRLGGQRSERLPGPGTGYRLEGERWERLRRLPHAVDARLLGGARFGRAGRVRARPGRPGRAARRGRGRARARVRRRARRRRSTASRTPTCSTRCSTASGAAARQPRLVRIRRSADVAFIGHDGALLSGSGIAVGLQSKGTALIHRADLPAARQPRALRDGAVADARLVPADRRQRRRLRARAPGLAGARR